MSKPRNYKPRPDPNSIAGHIYDFMAGHTDRDWNWREILDEWDEAMVAEITNGGGPDTLHSTMSTSMPGLAQAYRRIERTDVGRYRYNPDVPEEGTGYQSKKSAGARDRGTSVSTKASDNGWVEHEVGADEMTVKSLLPDSEFLGQSAEGDHIVRDPEGMIWKVRIRLELARV